MQSVVPPAGAQSAESGNPRQHRRMAVMEPDVERVGGEVAEVADAQLFQAAETGDMVIPEKLPSGSFLRIGIPKSYCGILNVVHLKTQK